MLKLAAILAGFAHLNVRIEKVGKDKHRPAVDLKFTVDVPNTMLDEIHPGLLNSLYKHPNEQGHQGDLTAPDPNSLTTPRYPRAKPWASTEDWPGYFIELRIGEYDKDKVPLDKATLKGISVEAKNGGTAVLTFTCSAYPVAEQVAQLYDMLGHDVEFDLTPPSIGDLERLRKEQAAGAAGNGSGGAPDDGPDDDADDQAGDGQQAAGRAFPDALDGRGDKPPSARRGKGKASAAAGASVH